MWVNECVCVHGKISKVYWTCIYTPNPHTHAQKHSSAWHCKGRNYALNMRSKEVVQYRKYIKKEGRKGEDGNYYGHIIG